MEKTIQGTFATSEGVNKRRILFNSNTGLILKVEDYNSTSPADFEFGEQFLIFGGMGDVHIHAREDKSGEHLYKEDFHSAGLAALNGGVVFAGDMPNNPIPPIDENSYREKLSLTQEKPISYFLYAGIGPGTDPLKITVPYKAYMGPSVGDLFFRTNKELDETLAKYQGQYVSFHCEDPEILEMHKMEPDHFSRRPKKAEILATHFALEMIEKYQLKGKLCHYSVGEGLPLIRKAREKGLSVQVEVTPQHLCFFEEGLDRERVEYFQMNPPIRHKEDQNSMLEAFKNNEIDFLATDHAPHSPEEKGKGTSGMPGLDTYGAFTTWLMQEKQVRPEIIAAACVERPGKFLGNFLETLNHLSPEFKKLGKGFGQLLPGYSASFTVLDQKNSWIPRLSDLKTKACDSPFIGFHFPGKVHQVFRMGQILNESNNW